MPVTIDIETVCTHQDLADETPGGVDELRNIIPLNANGSSLLYRQKALRDTLEALARRTPPIRQGDLQDVTELRAAVAYGALEQLYLSAITGPDSVFALKHKHFAGKFKAETSGLTPTVGGGSRGSAFSFSTERR